MQISSSSRCARWHDRYPDELEPRSRLATLFAMQQRWEEALVEVRAAVDMAPNVPSSYMRLGEVLVRLQRWNEALEAYEVAVQLEPMNVEAR